MRFQSERTALTLDGGAQYLYVDNLKTEEITEAKIAPAATNTAYAPSLDAAPRG